MFNPTPRKRLLKCKNIYPPPRRGAKHIFQCHWFYIYIITDNDMNHVVCLVCGMAPKMIVSDGNSKVFYRVNFTFCQVNSNITVNVVWPDPTRPGKVAKHHFLTEKLILLVKLTLYGRNLKFWQMEDCILKLEDDLNSLANGRWY